jgi:hypothetical protein
MTHDTLAKLWDEYKPWFVFLSATVPLATIILSSIFAEKQEIKIAIALSLLGYQLAFLLAMAFESQRLLSKRTPKRLTKIQLNDEFWKPGLRYKMAYINALNGERFFEMLREKNINVEAVRVIAPSRAATETYYAADPVVLDRTKAAQIMEDSVRSIETNLSEQVKLGHVGSIEVRRLSTFPLDFYAVFDAKQCLVGKYLKDPLRKSTIGLKSLSWVEDDIQLIAHHAQHFEELWDSLASKNAAPIR